MTMFSFLLIIISLLSQNQVFSSTVLLWSNSNLPQSVVPLATVSPLEIISNHICKVNSEEIEIRLFAVNDLTNENIQRGSLSQHSILIDAKNENSQYRYFPNVGNDVYKTFSLIPQSNNMQCSHIHFKLASSEIYETLNDALNAIQTSINSIETNSKTVTIMALIPGPVVSQTLTRQRRDSEVDEEDVILSDDQSCMFYAKEITLTNTNETSSSKHYKINLEKSTCTPLPNVENDNTTIAVSLKLYWDNTTVATDFIELTANRTGRYWYLEIAKMNNITYRYFAYGMHSGMDTPLNYSYVCTKAMFVKYNSEKHGSYDFTNRFFISDLQFQPYNGDGKKFGLPNYCTSFFTSGIWMGITSSLLCLGILLVGVYRMLSIKSNDRFDDPKGKALIIKAQE